MITGINKITTTVDRGAAMLKATERMAKFYDTIEIK